MVDSLDLLGAIDHLNLVLNDLNVFQYVLLISVKSFCGAIKAQVIGLIIGISTRDLRCSGCSGGWKAKTERQHK